MEFVDLDDLMGRTAAVMVLPYPSGTPMIMPGEAFSESTVKILDFLKSRRQFDSRFPGFEVEIHGLVVRVDDGKRHYEIDCVTN